MTYRIEIAKPAAKFIRSLPAPDKERMLRVIHKLPEEGDIKQMKGAKIHRSIRAVPQGALPRAKMRSSGRYARRDSNPQPSEPESDALSIEPLAHTP